MEKVLSTLLIICLVLLSACGTNSSIPTPNDMSTVSVQPPANSAHEKAYDAKAIKEDANAVWATFLESVLVMETDAKYTVIMDFYEKNAEVYSTHYAKVTGRDAQEYLELSSYEKFLWYSTYVTPVMATTYSDYETYFGSLAKWNSNVVGNAYNLLKNQGATEQAEAYKTIMEWQYNFFIEYGMMYNFITQQNSLEENPNYMIPERSES